MNTLLLELMKKKKTSILDVNTQINDRISVNHLAIECKISNLVNNIFFYINYLNTPIKKVLVNVNIST